MNRVLVLLLSVIAALSLLSCCWVAASVFGLTRFPRWAVYMPWWEVLAVAIAAAVMWWTHRRE